MTAPKTFFVVYTQLERPSAYIAQGDLEAVLIKAQLNNFVGWVFPLQPATNQTPGRVGQRLVEPTRVDPADNLQFIDAFCHSLNSHLPEVWEDQGNEAIRRIQSFIERNKPAEGQAEVIEMPKQEDDL